MTFFLKLTGLKAQSPPPPPARGDHTRTPVGDSTGRQNVYFYMHFLLPSAICSPLLSSTVKVLMPEGWDICEAKKCFRTDKAVGEMNKPKQ